MKGFNIVPKQRQVAAIALLLSTLSDREREVLNKVCLGYDAAAIADKQHVSTTTIQAHRARLLRKMGARNSVQLTYLIKSAETHHRSEEHTSELQSRGHLVCRLLLEKKKQNKSTRYNND